MLSGSGNCGSATTASWPASSFDVDDLVGAVQRRHDIVAAVQAAGYRYVTLDLEGFRSGNLNQALTGVRGDIATSSVDAPGAP